MNQQQNKKTDFDIITILTFNFLSLFIFTKEKQDGIRSRGMGVWM